MHIQIQKWGNSLALRIPKTYAKEAMISQGSSMNLSMEEGRIILTPVSKKSYSLKKLLSHINKNNPHDEIYWGAPKGKEVW